jgi:DNA-binding beta-propeller fold protein YncE
MQMRTTRRLGLAVATAAVLAALGGSAAGAEASTHSVFVQSDSLTGNQILAYDRSPGGTLSLAGTYSTGGLGGALEGSVVDHLASQASLTYDHADGLLFAVNAASNSVSVFRVEGDRLALLQVLGSGGAFPVSIALDHGLVYVLNAEEGGVLAGYRVQADRLVPIAGSGRALGLNPSATPQFVNTPGQVAFSPDGSQLIVTTKANGNDVDVFAVNGLGRLSAAPVVNALPGTVPFAVAFDRQGHLLLTEAGPSVFASFELRDDGTLAQLNALATEQAATCWVVRVDGRFYTSNAGSGTLSGFQTEVGGRLLAPIGVTHTDAGTVDAASPDGGRFLYVQTGAGGIVDEFAVDPSGALSELGSVTVPGGVGGEGIVAP